MKVFYHRADLDGLGSAAIIYNYYLENHPNYMPEFIGFDYKDNPDDVINSIEKDEQIFFVDCCLEPIEKLIELEKVTKTIHLIDHHASSILKYKKLEEEQNLYCFDVDVENARTNEHSAMYLVWKKFYPLLPVPIAVDYISKYDTWKHENRDDIMNFYMGLNHHIYNPKWGYKNEMWRLMFHDDIHRIASIAADGKIIREYIERQNYSVCLEGLMEIEFEGKKGVALNTPFRGSQNIQGVDLTKYDFSMVFVNLGDWWRYSIYTENPNCNASELAHKYGGGGHRGAAGFQTLTLIEEIINGRKYTS